jgi:hypothetical protein
VVGSLAVPTQLYQPSIKLAPVVLPCSSKFEPRPTVDVEPSVALLRQIETKCSALLANPASFTHNSHISGFGGIMPTIGLRSLQFGLMLATALSVLILPTTSEAYTQEQQAACSNDAFRLCSAEIPDVDRVTACMVRNQTQLSPGCRVYFRSEPEPVAKAGMPLSIKPSASRKRD